MVKYFCIFPEKIINLKPSRTVITDGFRERVPGLRIRFEKGLFESKTLGDRAKEAEQILDKLIERPGYKGTIFRYDDKLKDTKEAIDREIKRLEESRAKLLPSKGELTSTVKQDGLVRERLDKMVLNIKTKPDSPEIAESTNDEIGTDGH